MRIGFLIVSLVILLSCTSNTKRKSYLGFEVEAKWLNDSMPDGKAIFYNKSGSINSIQNFRFGLRNGPSIYFNERGVVTDSGNYYNGYKEGNHFSFSAEGKLIQKNSYLRGFLTGPSFTYEEGKLIAYQFITFEQQSPFFCFYNGDSVKVTGKPFFASTYKVMVENGKESLGVFFYLAHAPKLTTDFSLVKKRVDNAQFIKIRQFTESEFYLDTVLTPQIGEKFFLRTYFKDSFNKLEKIYMTQLN